MKVKYKKSAIDKVFDAYYEMGMERSLLELENITGVDFSTLKDWDDAYGWQEKISQKDKELDNISYLKNKEKAISIRDSLTAQIEFLINQMQSCSVGLPFAIKDVNDLKSLAQAYESLIRATVTMNSAKIVSDKESINTWSDLLISVNEENKEEN